MQRWGSELESNDELAADVYRANMHMRMAGQLTVRDIELAERDRVIGLRVESPDPFLRLPFTEAIKSFLDRGLVTPDEFAAMSDQERFRSFTMTRSVSQTITERALERLRQSVEPDGPGLQAFIREFADETLSPQYLENVYRTSTAVSYGAGRLEQQTRPEVASVLPYWEYVTVGDDRVRPQHAALDGAVFRVGDPTGLDVYPPNGFQCRCTMVSVDEDDVDLSRLRESLDEKTLSAVQAGFRGPPSGLIEEESN